MPVARQVLFICPKCNYSQTKMVGDVLLPSTLNLKCPKCDTPMETASLEGVLFGKLKELFFNTFQK